LRSKQFRKENKVAFIIGGRIEKELALLGELIEAFDRTHLVLDDADTDLFHRAVKLAFGTRDKIKVGPVEVGRVAAGFGIGGQIIGNQPFHGEAVGQLRRGIRKRLSGSGASAGYPSLEDAASLRTRGRNPLSVEVAKVMLSRNLEQGPGGWHWRTDPRLRHPSTMVFTEEQVMTFVRSVEAPTLLIRAEQGLLASFERWQKRFDALANVRCIDIDGGHHCHLDGDITPVEEGIRTFF